MTELSDNEVRTAALDCLVMLFDHSAWVHRRVEKIEFLDHAHVRRRVSLDLTLPADDPTPGRWAPATGEPEVFYIPIAALQKRSLVNFDLRDENDRPLPALSKHSNGALSTAMLRVLANFTVDRHLQRPLDDGPITEMLKCIAYGSPGPEGEARRAYDLLFGEPPTGSPPRTLEHIVVALDPVLKALAEQLVDRFVLVARVEGFPRQRRVLKFCYDSVRTWSLSKSVMPTVPRWRRWGVRLVAWPGVGGVPFPIPAPSAHEAASYHLEVSAPSGLVIEEAWLARRDDDSPTGWTRLGEPVWTESRVHFNPSVADMSRDGQLAEVRLRLATSGVLSAGVLSGIIVSAVFLGGLVLHAHEVHRNEHADAAAVLVSLIGVFTAVLGSTARHPLSEGIARGPLVLIYALAALAFGAAASLVLDLKPDTLEQLWSAGFATSFIVLALLAWAWIRSRSKER